MQISHTQAHARQRPRRDRARGSRPPDRRRQPLVSRRIEERAARPDRVRAPLRAPDVRGLAANYNRGYFQPLQEAGALLNGSTNADRTNYWEVVPTNALELALFLESDRMGYLLPALTPEKFANQRDVVLNERRQNYENRPYGFAGMAIASALYPPDHPYHWLTIGSAEDIQAATQFEDVSAFFRSYYHPGNASLVLAGDDRHGRGASSWSGGISRSCRRDRPSGRSRRPRFRRRAGRSGWSTKIGSSCRGSISRGARRRCSPRAMRPMMRSRKCSRAGRRRACIARSCTKSTWRSMSPRCSSRASWTACSR